MHNSCKDNPNGKSTSHQILNESDLYFQIIPASGFKYTYKLFVDGAEYETYTQSQMKILKTWEIKINEKIYRVVLGGLCITIIKLRINSLSEK